MWSNATSHRLLPPAFTSSPPNSNLSSYHFSFLKFPTEIRLLFPCTLRFQTLGVLKRFNGGGAVAALSYLPATFLLQYVAAISGSNPNPQGLGKLLSSAERDSRRSVSFSYIAKDWAESIAGVELSQLLEFLRREVIQRLELLVLPRHVTVPEVLL